MGKFVAAIVVVVAIVAAFSIYHYKESHSCIAKIEANLASHPPKPGGYNSGCK